MEHTAATENWQDQLTPLQRLIRSSVEFFVGAGRLILLCGFLVPTILASILLIDLPFRGIDHLINAPALRPSTWLTHGHLVMAFGAMFIVLISRRFGGEEASRVVTASWALAALAAFAEFTYLAPLIEAGDMPSTRFVLGFTISAMVGQYFAAALYDILRGGGIWWRAPFYALLAAFGLHTVLFYPITFGSSGMPWAAWMVIDFAIKAVLAFCFLGLYGFLRKRLRPLDGLGG
ncbi:MAG: VUT family protein [Pseudomonadota bacterium]